MSSVEFGEVDWNNADVSDGSGSDFMKLESQTKTRVRVMGNPTQFYIHWVTTPSGKIKKVNSPIADPKLVRKLNDADFKRKARWMIKVLDVASGEFKLLEIGAQIFNGIKELYADEEWGPVTKYDVNISRGAKGEQPLYRVTPCQKRDLDSSFRDSFLSFNDRVNMENITKPADPAEVREMLGWQSGGIASSESSSRDEDEYDFG